MLITREELIVIRNNLIGKGNHVAGDFANWIDDRLNESDSNMFAIFMQAARENVR